MSGIRSKVLVKHNPKSEFDRHEMVLIGRRRGHGDYVTIEYRDVNGGRRGWTTPWHIAVCNAPDCKAEMLVDLTDTIIELGVEAFK